MKYLKINNQGEIIYPYKLDLLKLDYPNTSFPEYLTTQILEDYSVYRVNLVNIPQDYTKDYSEGTPELIDGQYYQNWIVTDASPEEIQQRIESQWSTIRSIRNEYLQECDWTQLADSPLTDEEKQEWSIYRQKLRDITLQEDPFNINWPTKPN